MLLTTSSSPALAPVCCFFFLLNCFYWTEVARRLAMEHIQVGDLRHHGRYCQSIIVFGYHIRRVSRTLPSEPQRRPTGRSEKFSLTEQLGPPTHKGGSFSQVLPTRIRRKERRAPGPTWFLFFFPSPSLYFRRKPAMHKNSQLQNTNLLRVGRFSFYSSLLAGLFGVRIDFSLVHNVGDSNLNGR